MFIFNNIDFSDLVKVAKIERPFIAPQRIATTSIEGKSAEVFHRKNSASYNIEIEFFVFSKNGLHSLADIRELAGMLDTEAPERLVFKDEPDKYVVAILEETNIERKGRYAICKASFKVLDPYWYAVSDDVFEYSTTGVKSLSRKGNAESFPIVEITGTSGEYTIGANGSSMKFEGVLNAGEKLVIDSELLTAYIVKADNSKKSVINKLDFLDFPVLKKGNNNFTISTGNGAVLNNCKLICNSRWK